MFSFNSMFCSCWKHRIFTSVLLFGVALISPFASAADLTLTGVDAQTWGEANEIVNLTLDNANKYSGTFTLTDGTAKFVSNYGVNTFASGAKFVLGNGTKLDINGATIKPLHIETTGAVTITSSIQNTQNGVNTVSMGGDLTIETPVRYCIEGNIGGGQHEIFKTGTGEMVVKSDITNLEALHIQAGTWSVEGNVKGFGDGDVYLDGGSMKLWGANRDVSLETLYYNSGKVRFYSDGVGPQSLTGDIVLQADNAQFEVSSTMTFTGSISGADYTLVHSAIVSDGANSSGYDKTQTGTWKFYGKSATERGLTTLKNFKLTTRDSKIMIEDNADWNISESILGSSTGHELTVGANGTLTVGSISGIKNVTLNGASTIGTLEMTQDGGTLTIGADTTLGNFTVSNNTTVTTNANLTTTGSTDITTVATLVKNGSNTLTFGEKLTGTGTLYVEAGTISQTASASQFNSFGGQITLGNGGTMDLNSQQALTPTILCLNGSSVVNNRDSNAVYWNGANLTIDTDATVTLGGSARMAVAFAGGTANGGTLNVSNSYLFLNTELKKATLNVTGQLGIEGATTLNASSGNEVYLNLNGGTLTSWTGNNTYSLKTTQTTINGGKIKPMGHLALSGDVELTGDVTMIVSTFTSNDVVAPSSFRFNGKVSGNHNIVVNPGQGMTFFNDDVNVNSLQMTGANVTIDGGTFQADTYNIDSASTLTVNPNGTLVLSDGSVIDGKVVVNTNGRMKIGQNDTQAANVRLNSLDNVLDGIILFDVFSDESYDTLTFADDLVLSDISIELNLVGDQQAMKSDILLIQGANLSNVLATVSNPGWFSSVSSEGISVHFEANAIPEPATWVLFVLGVMGMLGFARQKTYKKVTL